MDPKRQQFNMIKDGFNSINDSLRKFAKKLGKDIVAPKEKEIKPAPPENQLFQAVKNGFEAVARTIESIDIRQPEDGKPGHTPTDAELLAIIKPLIPKLRQPEDGKTPTKEEILALIKPLIPVVKNGETPSDERLVALIKPLIPEIKIDEAGIVKKVVKTLEPMIPREESANSLAIKLGTKKEPWLPIEAIKGDWSKFWPKVVGAISSLRQLTDVDYSNVPMDEKGNYILGAGVKKYSLDFLVADWTLNGLNYELTVNHDLNSDNPKVSVLMSGSQVSPNSVSVSDNNTILLSVPATPDLRFAGSVSVV